MDPEEPKARVLHTRIPESLEDAIKIRARRLRVPVSNLVRNVLESAFNLVEDVVEDGLDIADTARRGAERVREAALRVRSEVDLRRDIYGWQEIVLNRDERCRDCGTPLDRGQKGFRGLSESPETMAIFLCAACVEALRSDTA